MQIQVIDQQQADPQRLRSMFIVRALRALDRLAPGILKLVGRFRDLNGPKGRRRPRLYHRGRPARRHRFRAEARAEQILTGAG